MELESKDVVSNPQLENAASTVAFPTQFYSDEAAMHPPKSDTITLEQYKLVPTDKPNVMVYSDVEGVEYDTDEMIKEALQCIEAFHDSYTAGVCFAVGFTCGKQREYISSIVSPEIADNLSIGKAIAMLSPPGSGKTFLMCQIAMLSGRKIIILTNRTACKIQLLKDILKKIVPTGIPPELLDKITLPNSIEVSTYQGFAQVCHRYDGKEITFLLDEFHSIVEDSGYSVCGQKLFRFFYRNVDNTVRIYMTATPQPVISLIWLIESQGRKIPELSLETDIAFLGCKRETTRLQRVYYIPPDWSYINIKAYDPHDEEKLLKYIEAVTDKGDKVIYLKNNIDAGRKFADVLGDDCQHLYAGEEKREEIRDVAIK